MDRWGFLSQLLPLMASLHSKRRAAPVVLLAIAGALLGAARPVASFVVPSSLASGLRWGASTHQCLGRACTLRQGLRMSGDAPKFEKKRNKVKSGTPSSRLLELIRSGTSGGWQDGNRTLHAPGHHACAALNLPVSTALSLPCVMPWSMQRPGCLATLSMLVPLLRSTSKSLS